jgi:hypothetical protein
MNKQGKVHEKFYYEIWKEQKFLTDLCSGNGEKIEVLDPGNENTQLSGPDFSHARIKIGNITYVGDVEIDSVHSDWLSHGHNQNKNYNKVILHVIFDKNQTRSFVFTQDGRRVNSVSLLNNLNEDLRSQVHSAILSERNKRLGRMLCAEDNCSVEEREKLNFIYSLGIERFKKKCSRYLTRMKEIIYLRENNLKEPLVRYELNDDIVGRTYSHTDFNNSELWQQLIFEAIFEALGYSKNKEIMLRLASSLDINYFRPFLIKKDFISYAESALFNISGLMPDVYNLPDEETSAYTKTLYEIWAEIKQTYDSRTFHAASWQFYKLRPQNFPTIRLAGGARIIYRILNRNLIGEIIKKSENIQDPARLHKTLLSFFIVKGEGFWSDHYVFDQPAKMKINYFIGASRAEEILINVIYPILSLYFEIFGKKELSRHILNVYKECYQKNENHMVEEVNKTLQLNDAWKRSILYQGMIDLYRNYCSKGKCNECAIGREIFG